MQRVQARSRHRRLPSRSAARRGRRNRPTRPTTRRPRSSPSRAPHDRVHGLDRGVLPAHAVLGGCSVSLGRYHETAGSVPSAASLGILARDHVGVPVRVRSGARRCVAGGAAQRRGSPPTPECTKWEPSCFAVDTRQIEPGVSSSFGIDVEREARERIAEHSPLRSIIVDESCSALLSHPHVCEPSSPRILGVAEDGAPTAATCAVPTGLRGDREHVVPEARAAPGCEHPVAEPVLLGVGPVVGDVAGPRSGCRRCPCRSDWHDRALLVAEPVHLAVVIGLVNVSSRGPRPAASDRARPAS